MLNKSTSHLLGGAGQGMGNNNLLLSVFYVLGTFLKCFICINSFNPLEWLCWEDTAPHITNGYIEIKGYLSKVI